MLSHNNLRRYSVLSVAMYLALVTFYLHAQNHSTATQSQATQEQEQQIDDSELSHINAIYVIGNTYVPTEAILDRIPYKVGELFDPAKTRNLIHRLYYDLQRFKNISIYAKEASGDRVDLYIVVMEKHPLKNILIEGNTNITEKEIKEKLHIDKIPAIDKEELKRYALGIEKLYKDKGYHTTTVSTDLAVDDDGTATALFTVHEHKRAIVKRVTFRGNDHISGKQLRNVLYTREDWLLSFMDKAGTYQRERIEADKQAIEQFYQNKGYINAKVIDVQTSIDPKTQFVTLTYEIQEGNCYTISEVKASGNNILKEECLIAMLPVKAGNVYSREGIIDSIKALELIWGDLGYAFVSIEPSVQPNDEEKTVSISFFADIGKPVFLNKLTIKGNKKTRDKVIRRKISLEEGGVITNRHMEYSKNRIEGLGYFDRRDGVGWKITRLADDLADLDLIVKEVKTGSAHLQIGFGGRATSIKSPAEGVTVEGSVVDTNLFGSGIRMNLTARVGAEEKTIIFNLTQPWLFDKPVFGSMDIYHKRVAYDQLSLTRPVNEKHTGGVLTTGFVSAARHPILNDTFLRLSLALDNINYEIQPGNTSPIPHAVITGLATPAETELANCDYNILLHKFFDPGAFGTFNMQAGKDAKNHPMHPTSGYTWLARWQVSAAALSSNIGFTKADLDVNWFTPLIGDFDLVLRLHGFFGIVKPFKNRTVPYGELFHIGGDASVRGFLFGQIGPQFSVLRFGQRLNDSIGGSKTFFVNAELIFPIMADFSMKGLLFYDGGAGWDNPFACCVSKRFIINNSFNYRHAVGVGLRLLNPMPIRVDWGFKLDRRKGETGSEVHFGMSYDW